MTGRNTSCQTRSVTNGISGAITRVSTSSVSCSVASAPASPDQNRRRERRTYQFESTSTNELISRPSRCVSNAAYASSVSRTSRCVSLTSQRSSTERSATAGASLGDQSASRAYRAWNATVFQ